MITPTKRRNVNINRANFFDAHQQNNNNNYRQKPLNAHNNGLGKPKKTQRATNKARWKEVKTTGKGKVKRQRNAEANRIEQKKSKQTTSVCVVCTNRGIMRRNTTRTAKQHP